MSVAPDEGMMLLQQQMHRRDITAPEAASPAAGVEVGADLGIMVRLAAAIESNTAVQRRVARINWELCHVINLPGAQTNAAGVIDDPDRWGPRQGWAWRLMGWTVILGSGTTSATIWEDSVNDPTNEAFSMTVSGRWEPSHYYLLPGSRFVWQSAGGGITLSKAKVVEFALDLLPQVLA